VKAAYDLLTNVLNSNCLQSNSIAFGNVYLSHITGTANRLPGGKIHRACSNCAPKRGVDIRQIEVDVAPLVVGT
jgi:hypothetical protein